MNARQVKKHAVEYLNFRAINRANVSSIKIGTKIMKKFRFTYEAEVIGVPDVIGPNAKYKIKYFADAEEEFVTETKLEKLVKQF